MSIEKEKRLRNTSFSPEERNLKKMDEDEENKNNNNPKNSGKIKKSKTLRSSVKMKKKEKEKKHTRKSSCNEIINSKKVKINSNVEIIDVESWKQYNLEQTADENFEELLKIEYENEKEEKENGNKNNTNNKNNKNNVRRVKGRQGNVSCTCIII